MSGTSAGENRETDAEFIKRMIRLRFDPAVRWCIDSKYRLPVMSYYDSLRARDWENFCVISENVASRRDWQRWQKLHPDLDWSGYNLTKC